MEAKLIKIDRNGSKHWQGLVTCDRCGGAGVYYIGEHNGQLVPAHPYNGTCYKCNGKGKVMGKWIERTPEYQAKLDARRQAKWDAWAAEQERIRKEAEAKAEAERLAEEARIKAQKAISQYVGEIGQRITAKVTYTFGTWWETKFGIQYLYSFKDADGNVLTWKTSSVPMVLNAEGKDVVINEGDQVMITGTVKEHSEYREEKQTVLTRCKLRV